MIQKIGFVQSSKIPKEVYRFLRDNHKCIGCGKCCYCSPIMITGKDIRVMACYLHMSVPDFKKQYTEQYPGVSGISHFKKENPCAFLDENNRCKIYEARPDMCRRYPLVKGERIPKECKTLLDLVAEISTEAGTINMESLAKAVERRKNGR